MSISGVSMSKISSLANSSGKETSPSLLYGIFLFINEFIPPKDIKLYFRYVRKSQHFFKMRIHKTHFEGRSIFRNNGNHLKMRFSVKR
uniref:Uncharacterized protein n=1 Tax=Parascaris univalens TaxID=6257 RepID=A0A915AJG2_PARUN